MAVIKQVWLTQPTHLGWSANALAFDVGVQGQPVDLTAAVTCDDVPLTHGCPSFLTTFCWNLALSTTMLAPTEAPGTMVDLPIKEQVPGPPITGGPQQWSWQSLGQRSCCRMGYPGSELCFEDEHRYTD